MKEKFYNWMINHEHKKANTAYSYKNSIDKISKHYSGMTDKKINIFMQNDIGLLETIAYDYSKLGKYSSFGEGGNGTIRNAIAAYLRFFKNFNGVISPQLNPINVANQNTNDDDFLEEEHEELSFAYERDLQNALVNQVNQLFPEYKIFGNNKEGVEYTIETKRIDLLLESKIDHSLLAIELKSGLADSKVFGQISSYLGLLMKAFPDKKISGMIIAGEIDDSLLNACYTTTMIKLKTYKMSISLLDVSN